MEVVGPVNEIKQAFQGVTCCPIRARISIMSILPQKSRDASQSRSRSQLTCIQQSPDGLMVRASLRRSVAKASVWRGAKSLGGVSEFR